MKMQYIHRQFGHKLLATLDSWMIRLNRRGVCFYFFIDGCDPPAECGEQEQCKSTLTTVRQDGMFECSVVPALSMDDVDRVEFEGFANVV